jgi:hypothetical protein
MFNREHKEQLIENYISSIDLNNIDINNIKNSLKEALGEIPAVKLNYEKEIQFITEQDGMEPTPKKVEKLNSIEITFIVEKDFEGKVIPVPITKKFIL